MASCETLIKIMLLIAIPGPILGAVLSAKLGRKYGLLAPIAFFLVGWLLVTIATHLFLLYVAEACWGIAAGILFTVLPLYCTEISTVRLKD